MQTFDPTVGSALAGDRYPALTAVDYSADMLQRTIPPDYWPDRLDYLAVERIAGHIRNQYVANLLSRAKRALAERFSRRPRATWSASR